MKRPICGRNQEGKKSVFEASRAADWGLNESTQAKNQVAGKNQHALGERESYGLDTNFCVDLLLTCTCLIKIRN